MLLHRTPVEVRLQAPCGASANLHTAADHVVLESTVLQLVLVATPAAVHDPEGNVVQFRVRAD